MADRFNDLQEFVAGMERDEWFALRAEMERVLGEAQRQEIRDTHVAEARGNLGERIGEEFDPAQRNLATEILAPLPGFVMYELSARLRGLGFTGVPLTAEFELDLTRARQFNYDMWKHRPVRQKLSESALWPLRPQL